VEGTQLAQVFGLGDGRSDGAADSGWCWGQGGTPMGQRLIAVVSTAIYINRR
jgi:hypothetical protein